MRLGDWKAIKINVIKQPDAAWQLFNLATDAGETIDVAKQHPAIIKHVDAILKKEHQSAPIKEWEFINH